MNNSGTNTQAYKQVVEAFKSKKKGATVADIVAKTALPLEQVKELVGQAADEYGARLEVTESGEILYSFPQGFKSRYRGLGVTLKRGIHALGRGLGFIGKWAFKVWIMLMLVGYFVFFMAIALLALVASVAVSASGSSDNRSSSRRGDGLGGLYLVSSIFDLIIRIWFYSEITKSIDRSYYGSAYTRTAKPKGKPLNQAVFSFVFGDGDPNADWEKREKQAVIAYIQANRGVISLPEFMVLTGAKPLEAEDRIKRYCVEFGGLPEATEDGTIVYRFDALLLRNDTTDRSFGSLSAPIKRLLTFSANPKKLNRWFLFFNAVNLLFGSYFLYSASTVGPLVSQSQIHGSSYLYAVAYILFSGFIRNPHLFITFVLGFVPIIFALLFYLIPGLRYLQLQKQNNEIKMNNLRKEMFRRIWETPDRVIPTEVNPQSEELRPENLEKSRETIVKDLGVYSIPDVALQDDGKTLYRFTDLQREKTALLKYRESLGTDASKLGETVFDTAKKIT